MQPDGWIQTFTDKAFWPLEPSVEDIDPADVAHALSMLCRYGGHSRQFYSVAEHCVLMSYAVAPEYALWALLHDATEAYLVDLPRPIKRQMPEYKEVEVSLMVYICKRFGIGLQEPSEVKEADNRILLDERDILLGPPPRKWSWFGNSEQPLGVKIECWSPAIAETRYLMRLDELGV